MGGEHRGERIRTSGTRLAELTAKEAREVRVWREEGAIGYLLKVHPGVRKGGGHNQMAEGLKNF